MKEKGKLKFFLCGKRGRVQVERLDRDRSESNAIFDRLKRGEIIEISRLCEKGKLFRLSRESSLKAARVPAMLTHPD